MSEFRIGSATVRVPPTSGLSVGMGLGAVTDWEQPVFLDQLKHSRQPQALNAGGTDFPLTEGVHISSTGELLALPAGATRWLRVLSSWEADYAQPQWAGNFVLTWTGTMTVTSIPGTITSSVAGRVEFTMPDPVGNKLLQFTTPAPGDMPRNIRLVRAQHEALANSGGIFWPEYVASVTGRPVLRFMDWQQTNAARVRPWSDRATPAHTPWSAARGVPLEVCIDLCNQAGASGWFNVPHGADDAYVTAMAQLIHDRLAPGLKCYVEYSNETWNTAFSVQSGGTDPVANKDGLPQFFWIRRKAFEEWSPGFVYNDSIAPGNYWETDPNFSVADPGMFEWPGKRSTECSVIFKQVWADRWQDFMMVMGTQATNAGVESARFSMSAWQTADPVNAKDPVDWHGAVATTFYHNGLRDGGGSVQGYRDAYAVSPANADAFLDSADGNMINTILLPDFAAKVAFAQARGLRVFCYEGGNHNNPNQSTDPANGFDQNNPADVPLIDRINAYNRSAAIGARHQQVLDGLKAAGIELICWFVNVNRHTVFGAWGLERWIGENNASKQAVDAWEALNPRWWIEPGRGGPSTRTRRRLIGPTTVSLGQVVGGVPSTLVPATQIIVAPAKRSPRPLSQSIAVTGHSILDAFIKQPFTGHMETLGAVLSLISGTGPFATAQGRWTNDNAGPDQVRAAMEAPAAAFDLFCGIEASGGDEGGRQSVQTHITFSGAFLYAQLWADLAASTGAETYYANFWRDDAAQLFDADWRLDNNLEIPLWDSIITDANANRAAGTPPLRVVPLLEVFLATWDAINSGFLTGMTMGDAFADGIHEGGVGQWMAMATFFAVLWRRHPDEFPRVDTVGEFGVPWPTPAVLTVPVANTLRRIIWEVVTSDPRTGVMA